MTGSLRISIAMASSIAVACIALAGAVPGTAAAAGQVPTAVTVQAAATRVMSFAYVPATRTLEYGMHGDDPKALRQRLAQLAYYPGPADGQFGADTLEAVWAFQAVQGLNTDGVAGPVTQRAPVSPRAPQPHDPNGGALRIEVNLQLRVLLLYRDNELALVSQRAGRLLDAVPAAGATPWQEPGYRNQVRVTGYPASADAPITCTGWTSEQSPSPAAVRVRRVHRRHQRQPVGHG